MNRGHDIIIAPASPPGRGARAMIRLSGHDLDPLIQHLFGRPLTPRELARCRLRLSPAATVSTQTLALHTLTLPVLAMSFSAPRSFTAEHVLEIQFPGHPALIERLLRELLDLPKDALCGRAMRLAEAGEFTRRAFLAGHIDLTRAEGIAATIGAESDAQLQASSMLRQGRLGHWAESLVDRLANLLALVEAGIDFTDQDDVSPIAPAALDAGLAEIQQQVRDLTARSRAWSTLDALPWVVLVGPPNVGKTTLFNALLGYERAVTAPIAGTTRDVLCEPLRLHAADGEAEVMLVDLAGLERPETALQQAAQDAAHRAIQRAELLLWINDRTTTEASMDATTALGGDMTGRPTLRVQTKTDLSGSRDDVDVAVSAMTGQGVDVLQERIAGRLRDRAVALSGQVLALQPRHAEALQLTADQLDAARALLDDQRAAAALADMELIAEPMRAALDALGALGGQISPDDVIGRVFATFCVGK